MRILFVTHSAFLPEFMRGQERNTDQLCQALKKRGHEPAVLAGLISSGFVGKWASLRSRFGEKRRALRDRATGYPVYRSWDVDFCFDAVLDTFKPDVVVVQSWIHSVVRCVEREIPVAYYVHLANEAPDPGSDRVRDETLWLTVSQFAARHNGTPHGLNFHVVPPLVEPERYRLTTHERKHATFVGLQSDKGGEVVVKLARACPEIPFLIIDSNAKNHPDWPGMSGDELRAAVADLTNVTIRQPVKDPQSLYGTTKVLLAPSRWTETWGRVASEAQINGIPVLASNRGGLPESVGSGGVCLDYDAPIELWAAHLRKMWHDDTYYAELSQAALAYSQRPEFQPDAIVDRLFDLIEARAHGIVVPAPRLPRDMKAAEAVEAMLA